MDLTARKLFLLDLYRRLDAASGDDPAAVLRSAMHSEAVFHTVHPLNDLHGPDAVSAGLFAPLRTAIPDLERRPYAVMAGGFKDADWVCGMGVLQGTFTKPWLGIAPTEGLVNLRFGEFHKMVDGKIAESFAIYDLIDFLRQAGINPLPEPPAGVPDIFPAPMTGDAVPVSEADARHTSDSLQQVEAMIFGLHKFKDGDLARMGMDQFWDPQMLWYGPGGIGANRGVAGFQRYHQKPFLTAFPDRVGGNHKARFADGRFVASTGWPSINATHAGSWLGVPGQNNPITMRVMDWWRCEGDLLKENWVFIDIPHVLLQSGFDVFGRLGSA
jgi:predicted ester cyclase